MDLITFKSKVLEWISHENLKLSGVALLHDGSVETWSASLFYVNEEGSWPEPSESALPELEVYVKNKELKGFNFKNLYIVEFIMTSDVRARRWQVQWTFRG